MSIEKKIGYPLAGIEAGPSIIKDAVGDWGVGAEEISNTGLEKSIDAGIGEIQNLAVPAATFCVVWAGLNYMFKGLEGDSKS